MINLDFADVKTVMFDRGIGHMGIGKAAGDERAVEAAKLAIKSPLLETSIDGAKAVLINITGGQDLGLFEVNEAADLIRQSVDGDANIIFGAGVDESLEEEIKITVIATGFDDRVRKSVKKESLNSVESEEDNILEEEYLEEDISTEKEDLDIPVFLRKKN